METCRILYTSSKPHVELICWNERTWSNLHFWHYLCNNLVQGVQNIFVHILFHQLWCFSHIPFGQEYIEASSKEIENLFYEIFQKILILTSLEKRRLKGKQLHVPFNWSIKSLVMQSSWVSSASWQSFNTSSSVLNELVIAISFTTLRS